MIIAQSSATDGNQPGAIADGASLPGPPAPGSTASKPPGKVRSPGKSRLLGKSRSLGRVLVVEDDPILAVSIEAALLDGGAETVAICNTLAATLVELEIGRPDAIILDVHLADRDDGWALAELVSVLGPSRPKIIFSTGSPGDIPPEIAEMGPVFEKPYDPVDLVVALRGERRLGLFARLRGERG